LKEQSFGKKSLWGVEMKEGLGRSRLKGLGELWIEFEGREKKKTLCME